MALPRAAKEATVQKLKDNLEDSTAVLGFSFAGLSVPQMEKLRRTMPEDANIVVCKNKLMLKAVEGDEKWVGFDTFCEGSNAFMFIREDIPGSFKPLRSLQKEEKDAGLATINGCVSDGKALSEADIKAFEKLPSKQQLIAMIAGAIKAVPTKVAVGVRQVPTKLAVGVKKISEADDEPAAQAAAQAS